ncbi:glycosyltransferase-like KOBITO 1 [Citrus sinensis]|nr:glycosyltransferase-like KOBITO 1 [Citrus sinensis]
MDIDSSLLPATTTVRSSSSSSTSPGGCADILGRSNSLSFSYFKDWKFDYGADLKPKAASPAVSKVFESIPGVKVIYRTRELEEQQAKRRVVLSETISRNHSAREAARNNPNYFLTYGNGKAAARVQDHLRPNGAHRWHNYMKNPMYGDSILH